LMRRLGLFGSSVMDSLSPDDTRVSASEQVVEKWNEMQSLVMDHAECFVR
jgi:hypothetical protein